MLRLSIISSIIPLALAGGVTHDWMSASNRPCLAAETLHPTTVRQVAFTEDPARATVRVQLVDAPELADLAIVEDTSAVEAHGCSLRDAVRSVAITAQALPGEPVIYLSREADANYRVYVDSAQVSAQQAAALIVSARGGHTQLAAGPAGDEVTGSLAR